MADEASLPVSPGALHLTQLLERTQRGVIGRIDAQHFDIRGLGSLILARDLETPGPL